MQLRTNTLSTAFRTVPRRLRTTLTKTPCTLHPSEGPRGLRRQLLRRGRANYEKAVSDKTITQKAVVEKAAEDKLAIAKSIVANVAVEEVDAKTKRIRTRRRYNRMYQGTLDLQQLEEKRKHAGFLGGVS